MATITSALQQDSAGNNVQVTAKFICQDGSDTPKTSPLVFTTSGLTLVVPDDAYELVATPTNDLFVSDTFVMTGYDTIQATTKESFPCIRMTNVFIKGATLGGTVHFRWHTL
jgi:hypothetical protein|tara:strand:- start:1952 stop:2287 length:336 start_codon:yes stop_codon:yes gene_type:complete